MQMIENVTDEQVMAAKLAQAATANLKMQQEVALSEGVVIRRTEQDAVVLDSGDYAAWLSVSPAANGRQVSERVDQEVDVMQLIAALS